MPAIRPFLTIVFVFTVAGAGASIAAAEEFTIEQLISGLTHAKAGVREKCKDALIRRASELNAKDASVLAIKLGKQVEQNCGSTRTYNRATGPCRDLQRMGTKGAAAASMLMQSLTRVTSSRARDRRVLQHCMGTPLLRALASLGPAAKGAVPELQALARDPNSPLRVEACKTLGEIGPQAAGAVAVLSINVKSDQKKTRVASIEAMAKIGLANKQVHQALLSALRDPFDDSDVRAAAKKALKKLGLPLP